MKDHPTVFSKYPPCCRQAPVLLPLNCLGTPHGFRPRYGVTGAGELPSGFIAQCLRFQRVGDNKKAGARAKG